MNSLFAILLHLLFWQRLLRGLFYAGVVLIMLGLGAYAYTYARGADTKLSLLVAGIGGGLALMFSLLTVPFAFRQLLGNRQLALVPRLRRQAGLALFLITSIVAVLLGSIAWFIDDPVALPRTVLIFGTLSAYLLLAQWVLAHKWGAFVFWLLPTVLLQLSRNKTLLPWLLTPEVALVMLVLSLLVWFAFAHWLRGLRNTSAPRFVLDQWNNPELQQQQHHTWLSSKFTIAGIRSASGSLLRGSYDNWRNRLLMQFLLFFMFPVLLNLFLEVLEWNKGNYELKRARNPDTWLMMGLFGSLMVHFYTREWLPRARLLWLRSGGDRRQMWQLIQRMSREEVLLSSLISAAYALLLWLLLDLAPSFALTFVLLCTSAVWFTTYVGHWSRLRDWGWLASMILLLLMLPAMIIVLTLGFKQDNAQLPLLFALACVVLGGIAEYASKQRFLRIDWCRLRPLTVTTRRQCS